MAHLCLICLRLSDTNAKKNNFIFVKSWDNRNMEISEEKSQFSANIKIRWIIRPDDDRPVSLALLPDKMRAE